MKMLKLQTNIHKKVVYIVVLWGKQ